MTTKVSSLSSSMAAGIQRYSTRAPEPVFDGPVKCARALPGSSAGNCTVPKVPFLPRVSNPLERPVTPAKLSGVDNGPAGPQSPAPTGSEIPECMSQMRWFWLDLKEATSSLGSMLSLFLLFFFFF